MKIRLTFKSPDAVDLAVEDLPEEAQAEARAACKRFVQYGEYVFIEVDTEAETATVVPV